MRGQEAADASLVDILAAFSGAFIFAVILSLPDRRWMVVTAVALEAVVAAAWTLFVLFTAVPCGLSGRGILEPTPQCPVETGFVVRFVVGVPSCLALLVSTGAGLLYSIGARKG